MKFTYWGNSRHGHSEENRMLYIKILFFLVCRGSVHKERQVRPRTTQQFPLRPQEQHSHG